MNNDESKSHYMTTKQVAEILNVSESLIRKLVFRNEIPYIKVRSLVRFREIDVHKWIKQQQERSEGEL